MASFSNQLIICPHCGSGSSYQMSLGPGTTTYVSCRVCYKRIQIRTNMNSSIDRILPVKNEGENRMKTCPKCKKELRDEAKFCGACGFKFPLENSISNLNGAKCPSCGTILKEGAKFCGKCGIKIENSMTANEIDISKQMSFIQWNILPGQLAIKIDSKEIASYGRVKGLVIQEGIKALFFVNGKLTSELAAGSYEFKNFPDVKISDGKDDETKKQNFVLTFFNNVRNFFRNVPVLPQNVQNVTVVLIRSVEFPLLFSIKEVSTIGIRSEIGLHFICKISNINDFYINALLDRKFVSFELLKETIEPYVKNILNKTLSSVTPDKVELFQNEVLISLQNQIPSIYSYIQVERIISLTAINEEIENIRRMQEELYVSELELVELTKRNSFLNRMQDETNAQALREARSAVDFQAALDKIDQDKELNEEERNKFTQMLEAQRVIREAKTKDEVDAAIAVFRKSEMLREEEIENIQAQITQNSAIRNLDYEQSLNLATLANEKELDRQKLEWEIEIGNKRVENELLREKLKTDFEDERRRSEMQLDKEEQLNQLELLRQAQELRNERENAEHKRRMESEQLKIQHEEEMQRMFKSMTAEQIVAANPNITPEAAAAMAEKFKAEAIASTNDKTAEMAMKQSVEMQQFMKEQMQMMRDMALAGMAVKDNTQKALFASKQDEINRFADGVNNAVNAVSSALKNPNTIVQNGTNLKESSVSKSAKVCPNCNKKNEDGAMFCESCGTSL